MASSGSGNTSIVHKSRQTILEYLSNQGYNISDYENTSINEVHIMLQNKQLDMLLENDEGKKVGAYNKYLFFVLGFLFLNKSNLGKPVLTALKFIFLSIVSLPADSTQIKSIFFVKSLK